MHLLLVSALGAVAIGFALIRFARRHSEDRTPDYMSLFICLLGTFAGFALAFSGADLHRKGVARDELLGLLDAEIGALETMMHDVTPLVLNASDAPDTVRLKHWTYGQQLLEEVSSVTTALPILEQLSRDGDLFSQLSDPMKVSLHRIVESTATWEGCVFSPDDEMPSVRFDLGGKLLQMRYLRAVVGMEQQFLSGDLTPDEHATCFDDTSMAYAQELTKTLMERWGSHGY